MRVICIIIIGILRFTFQVTFCKRADSLYQQEWMHGHCELLSHMIWVQPYKHFNTEYPHPVIDPSITAILFARKVNNRLILRWVIFKMLIKIVTKFNARRKNNLLFFENDDAHLPKIAFFILHKITPNSENRGEWIKCFLIEKIETFLFNMKKVQTNTWTKTISSHFWSKFKL